MVAAFCALGAWSWAMWRDGGRAARRNAQRAGGGKRGAVRPDAGVLGELVRRNLASPSGDAGDGGRWARRGACGSWTPRVRPRCDPRRGSARSSPARWRCCGSRRRPVSARPSGWTRWCGPSGTTTWPKGFPSGRQPIAFGFQTVLPARDRPLRRAAAGAAPLRDRGAILARLCRAAGGRAAGGGVRHPSGRGRRSAGGGAARLAGASLARGAAPPRPPAATHRRDGRDRAGAGPGAARDAADGARTRARPRRRFARAPATFPPGRRPCAACRAARCWRRSISARACSTRHAIRSSLPAIIVAKRAWPRGDRAVHLAHPIAARDRLATRGTRYLVICPRPDGADALRARLSRRADGALAARRGARMAARGAGRTRRDAASGGVVPES